jgi:phosphate:Na+ symporter
MGSSLVNDSMFTHDIAMNLIQAAQILIAAADRDLREAANKLVLDASDLSRVSQSSAAPAADGPSNPGVTP